jgi:hypothetical protein
MSFRRAGLTPLAFLLLLAAGAVVWGQQPPPAPAANPPSQPPPTVMVVDVQALLQNSKSAKMVRQQIEQKRAEYAKEI